MTHIGQYIRHLRERAGLSQIELAKRLDLSQSGIQRREAGLIRVKPNELESIAGALGIAVESFDENFRQWKTVSHTARRPGIPVVNRAPAGLVLNYEEHGVANEDVFEHLDWGDIEDEAAFALIVVGDAMEPAVREGDYLIFSPLRSGRDVPNGKIVFARFADTTATSGRRGPEGVVARWYDEGDRIRLQKDNPRHPPAFVRPIDLESIAVAVERRQKL